MRCKSLLLACSAFALAAGSAHAAEWRLVEVSGTVRIAVPGAEAMPARLNQAIPTGSSVTTTLGARAALDNGLQHIVVGPNSRMTVAPEAGGFTRVMQDLGAVMFKVDKQKAPHFRVDTPLLAAVVKGTTFTVVVGPQADSVNVAEGLVEVRSNGSDIGSDVPAGSSGAVSRDAPQSVQVSGAMTPTSGEAVAMKIEPLDYKSVSGGLVDSGGPAMISNEMAAAASGNASASMPTGANTAAPAALAMEVARNDRQPEAAVGGGNGLEAGGANPLSTTSPGNNGNGNGGGAAETGNPGTSGNGNGNNGNGNGGAATGNAGTSGNGNGNNGNGNGNGGAATETGNAGTSGNGNGNNGNGNGNGGGATETGNAGTSGNGNGNNGNGNGNGGGATETGNAGTSGNGNGNSGNGNGNGASGGLVGDLLTTVGGVTEGVTGAGKGRGPK